MKMILLIFASVFAISASAQERLTDLNYLTPEGANQLKGFIARGTGGYEINSVDVDASVNALAVRFERGILDSMMIFAELTYGNSEQEAGAASFNSKGFDDPDFGAQYRILKQADSGFVLDVEGQISPAILDAEDSTATSDGTLADGATEVDIFLAAGKEMEQVGFRFKMGGSYSFEGKLEDGSGGEETTEAHFAPELEIQGQFKPTPVLALSAILGVTFNPDVTSTDNSGTESISESHRTTEIGIMASYLAQENLSFQFALSRLTISDYNLGTSAVSDYNVTMFGLFTAYQF